MAQWPSSYTFIFPLFLLSLIRNRKGETEWQVLAITKTSLPHT